MQRRKYVKDNKNNVIYKEIKQIYYVQIVKEI